MRIPRLTIAVLAAAFALSQLSASAQQTPARLSVGDIDGSRLHDYDNVWLVRVTYPDGHSEDRGLSSDHVRIRDLNGRRVLTRIEGTTTVRSADATLQSGFSETFNVVDASTLAPIKDAYSDQTGQAQVRTFDQLEITTDRRDEHGAHTSEHVTLATPAFDFDDGMTGLILAALPLQTGYRAEIATIGEHGADWAKIEVLGRERVQAGRLGQIMAWRVQVGEPQDGVVYWVRNTAPYVIKVSSAHPHGIVATWTMI